MSLTGGEGGQRRDSSKRGMILKRRSGLGMVKGAALRRVGPRRRRGGEGEDAVLVRSRECIASA